MKLLYWPLRLVEKWPANPKDHDLWFLEESIEKHGFNDPLARDANTGKLAEGHGRTDALRDMKSNGTPPPENVHAVQPRGTWPSGESITVAPDADPQPGDWLVPVLELDFDDENKLEAYMMAHNRAAERGGWDDELLAQAFQRQYEHTGDVADTGFSPDEAQALLQDAGVTDDVDPEDPGNIDFGDDDGPHTQGPNTKEVLDPSDVEDQKAGGDGATTGGIKTIQVMLQKDQYEKLHECLADLKDVFGVDTTSDAIREAVLDCHENHYGPQED
jgi:hypothetical protein